MTVDDLVITALCVMTFCVLAVCVIAFDEIRHYKWVTKLWRKET